MVFSLSDIKSTIFSIVSDFKSFILEDFDKRTYGFIFIFLSIAISLNYYFDFEDSILDSYKNQLIGLALFFAENVLLYVLPLFVMYKNPFVKKAVHNYKFWGILLISLFLLSFYQNYNLISLFWKKEYYETYFSARFYSRVNSLLIYSLIFIILGVIIGKGKDKVFGFLEFKIKWKVYVYFLLAMIPLLLLAATQSDFLQTYPRLHISRFSIEEYFSYFFKYEPFYLLDFVFLEWFFRGFMVIMLAKFIDKRAVILIAGIYCAFHFGKPMAECISSFFGGYILGYMSYRTKSIWGGVMVHMGIAFLMDILAIIAQV